MGQQTIRCPYCTKGVKVSKKGFVLPHVTSGGVKCVGIGFQIKKGE